MIRVILDSGLEGLLLDELLEIPEFNPCFGLEAGGAREEAEAAVIERRPEKDFPESFPRLKLLIVVGLNLSRDLEKELLDRKIEIRCSAGSDQAEKKLEIMAFLRDFFNV